MISKILYAYFTLGRLSTLATKLKTNLSTQFPEQAIIVSLVGKMDVSIQVALQALGSSTKQGLTKTIRQADSFRDDSYVSLRNHIKAGLSRHNEAYQAACKALWPVFEKNGLRLFKFGDEEETSAIESLLLDLATAEMQGHLATINAVEWLGELNTDNQSFVNLSLQRSQNRVDDDTLQDSVAFRKLKASLELLRSTMETLSELDSIAGLDETMAQLNQLVSEANAAAKSASANRTTEDPEAEE